MAETTTTSPGAPTPARERRIPGGAVAVMIVGILIALAGIGGFGFLGKLGQVQDNDNSAYLPASAQSTKVDAESQRFQAAETIPGFVVYHRTAGLTSTDRSKIAGDAATLRTLPGVASDQVAAPAYSADGTTANISVALIAKQHGVTVKDGSLIDNEKRILATARSGAPPGLVVHTAGAGGLLVAYINAFKGIDGALLLAAGLVVIIILLIVYRSPILWFFPLFSAILALGAAALIIYPLAKGNALTLNGQSQGILSVLVLGAGTDYALLLVSRYREELHHYEHKIDAMVHAWRRAAPAIGASAITVILGLLCLTFGELNSDRSLGPVCAIGIACTVVVMLTFLPLFLWAVPRFVFWPRIPRPDEQGDRVTKGPWAGFARRLGGRARVAWILVTMVLVVCALGMTTLKTGGLSTAQGFTTTPDAVTGQEVFDAHFPNGQGAPAMITASASTAPQVIDAVRGVPGVASSPGSVCPAPDYAKLSELRQGGSSRATSPASSGCLPSSLSVSPQRGRLLINATLTNSYDTNAAYQTVQRIRTAVAGVPGADALVGGQSAINLDTQNASRHDRDLIIPIILVVILIVLGLLLRALVAPILLILTVVLSFAATLGVSAVVFNHVLGFANADPAFPLFAFVFLVALGVDYNIFLMTRVREEAMQHGTRDGVLRGLAVTGGVITSAGLVLAATFAVLGVLPLVSLAEVGFAVAFGVLLDTIVVRSILVPALAHDLGRRIWWPSSLARGSD